MGYSAPTLLSKILGFFHGYLPLGLLTLGCLASILALIVKLLRKRRSGGASLPLFHTEPPALGSEQALAPAPPPPPIEAVERCVAAVASGRCVAACTGKAADPGKAWFFAIVRDERLLAGMRLAEPQLVEAPYVVALFRRGAETQGDMAGKLITGLHKASLCTLPCTPRAGAVLIRSLLRRPDAESLQLLLPVFSSGAPLRAADESYDLGDFAAVY